MPVSDSHRDARHGVMLNDRALILLDTRRDGQIALRANVMAAEPGGGEASTFCSLGTLYIQEGAIDMLKQTTTVKLISVNAAYLGGVFAAIMIALVVRVPCFAAEPAENASVEQSSKSSGVELREIVVTAQKRESTIQDTPISITAYSGQYLQESGITTPQGVAQLVPGLSVTSAGPGQASYEMRGLSSDGGQSPTIGFYLDEIAITPPAQATTGKAAVDPDLYDLLRVEVLRGPQGTLYGSGSMGGTIKFVNTPPNLEKHEGSAESALSGTEGGGVNYSERAMINLPIINDIAALRIVGAFTHDSGWIDRVVVPNFPLETNPAACCYGVTQGKVSGVPGSSIFKNVNDTNSSNARAILLVHPTDRLQLTASFTFLNTYQGGVNAFDSDPGTLAHYQPSNIAEPFNDRFTLSSLVASYNVGAFDVTSVTGYWSRLTVQHQDGTQQTQNFFMVPSYQADSTGIGPATAFESDQSSQFSQEVRLSSRSDGALKWLVGGYFEDYHYELASSEYAPGLLTLQPTSFPTPLVFSGSIPQTISQAAGFGNVSYTTAKGWTLAAGVRYFSYNTTAIVNSSGALYTGSDQVNTAESSSSAHGWTPMANISYKFDENLMVYTSAAKGFREGSGNLAIPTTGPLGAVCLADLEALGRTSAPLSYAPDTVWTYELGEKAKFADGRITFDSDVYFTRYTDIQQPVALGCGLGYTDNAATAQVKGGEIDARARITDHISVTQTVGFAHAVFTASSVAANIADGQRLLDVPEWTVSTTIDYRRPLSDRRSLFATVTNSYVSSYQNLSYILNTVPARDLTNARLGLEIGQWSLALFVNNAFNQVKPTEFMNLLTFTGPPYNRVATTQPLTAGIVVNVHF
jgi:iron complex outermembrane receptor protein